MVLKSVLPIGFGKFEEGADAGRFKRINAIQLPTEECPAKPGSVKPVAVDLPRAVPVWCAD